MKTPPLVPRSPLDLPAVTSGRYAIIHEHHEPGAMLPVISMRTEYHSAEQAVYIELEEPLRIHQLLSDEGVWMSDKPEELLQMWEFAQGAHGDVLIGGLGLGLVARFCAANPNVTHVDVIELSTDVITLASPGLPEKVHVIHDDLFDFLHKTELWLWDTAYFDIWQGTGRGTHETFVAPLRSLIAGKFGQVDVKYWAEEEMLK